MVWDEALRFAVGLRAVGSGVLMAQAELVAAVFEGMRAVTRSIVREDGARLDTALMEGYGRFFSFVSQDFQVGQAGSVIDRRHGQTPSPDNDGGGGFR